MSADRPLDSTLAKSQIIRDAPNDLVVKDHGITRIGNLSDVSSLRLVDISFNPIHSLAGIDQLKELRHLIAYCCCIEEVDALAGTKRLEKLLLQQNQVARITEAFRALTKLRELRMDRNRLVSVDNLSKCIALRVLDLSHNQLTSLEGVAGLQCLEELRISNNAIRSLRALRGLPALVELDCSCNALKSLDGLQFVPTLSVVRADHNSIVHLKLGDTDDEGSASSGGSSSTSNSKTARRIQQALTSNPSSAAEINSRLNDMNAAIKGSRAASTALAALGRKNSVNGSNAAANSTKNANVSKMRALTELYLRGNRIKSLDGLPMLGNVISTLDLSQNSIALSNVNALTSCIGHLHSLSEIRLGGNPLLSENSAATDTQSSVGVTSALREAIMSVCPSIRNIDETAVVSASDTASLEGASLILNEDGTLSSTWVTKESGSSKDASAGSHSSPPIEGSPQANNDDEDVVDDGSEDEDEDEDELYRRNRAKSKIANPTASSHVVDDTMLSADEITDMETSFRSMLSSLPAPPLKDGQPVDLVDLEADALLNDTKNIGLVYEPIQIPRNPPRVVPEIPSRIPLKQSVLDDSAVRLEVSATTDSSFSMMEVITSPLPPRPPVTAAACMPTTTTAQISERSIDLGAPAAARHDLVSNVVAYTQVMDPNMSAFA